VLNIHTVSKSIVLVTNWIVLVTSLVARPQSLYRPTDTCYCYCPAAK